MNNVFYERKAGLGSKYNYDLGPLIDNFTFYDFVSNVNKKSFEDYGAFIVITGKQYITGYNAGFGFGTHMSSLARTMKDIKGGGYIYNLMDASELCSDYTNRYLTGRVSYEKVREDEGNSIYYGGIHFILPVYFTEEQFEVFKEFYNVYKDDIDQTIKKCNGSFYLSVYDTDKKTSIVCDNLDEIYRFLESKKMSCKEYGKTLIEEKIIGVEVGKLKK